MNYEERYNQALEIAKHYHDRDNIHFLEHIFPELRESEDEKIRKELLEHCINRRDGKQICVDASDYRRWAAWLEKHGEQKHEIVPKFRVGDTIRFKGNETLKGEDKIHRIIDYDNELYVFDDGTTDLFSEQNLYELVEQKQEWSEEDEKMLDSIIDCIDGLIFIDSDQLNWLKSLKPNHWKPSEEQMNALDKAKNSPANYYDIRLGLQSLYNDLTRL